MVEPYDEPVTGRPEQRVREMDMRTVAGMLTSRRRKAQRLYTTTATATDVSLTAEGRAMLEGKAAELREETLPTLLRAIAEDGSDEQLRAEYERRVTELLRLEAVLAEADPLAPPRSRSGQVKLGHLITVAYLPSGADDANDADLPRLAEQFLLVHPVEAPLDLLRISITSPLGQAVLGCRVGDIVEFDAPAGRHVVRILDIEEPT
jgi:transcription elongation GreA/GreB family factor